MFTGLVEETGTLAALEQRQENARLQISARIAAIDTRIGDSICVSGCCLTVVEMGPDKTNPGRTLLGFDAVPETLQRTSLGQLTTGAAVNLERSLLPDSRLGGHFVTGHIDGTATVDAIEPHEEWRVIWFALAPELTRQMAAKGSVTVDGISLTLVNVSDDRFSVALVPHTLESTTIGQQRVGDTVNIETDLLAKYVQRQLAARGDI